MCRLPWLSFPSCPDIVITVNSPNLCFAIPAVLDARSRAKRRRRRSGSPRPPAPKPVRSAPCLAPLLSSPSICAPRALLLHARAVMGVDRLSLFRGHVSFSSRLVLLHCSRGPGVLGAEEPSCSDRQLRSLGSQQGCHSATHQHRVERCAVSSLRLSSLPSCRSHSAPLRCRLSFVHGHSVCSNCLVLSQSR
jgi:hypothetical protein